MEAIELFKQAIGPSLCLKLDSHEIKLETTFEKGNCKVWFETETRSAYLHFNEVNLLASDYGKTWQHPKTIIETKIFKDLKLVS